MPAIEIAASGLTISATIPAINTGMVAAMFIIILSMPNILPLSSSLELTCNKVWAVTLIIDTAIPSMNTPMTIIGIYKAIDLSLGRKYDPTSMSTAMPMPKSIVITLFDLRKI